MIDLLMSICQLDDISLRKHAMHEMESEPHVTYKQWIMNDFNYVIEFFEVFQTLMQ
jgi:hypothetical protein